MDKLQEEQAFKNKIVENKIIANGTLVEEGIKSDFWQEIVGPELYRLINAVGAHQAPNGMWLSALSLKRNCSPDERTFDAGYQTGLIEFSNNILSFVKFKDNVAEARSKRKPSKEVGEDLVLPMEEEDEDQPEETA